MVVLGAVDAIMASAAFLSDRSSTFFPAVVNLRADLKRDRDDFIKKARVFPAHSLVQLFETATIFRFRNTRMLT
jgi:hypothetical protein